MSSWTFETFQIQHKTNPKWHVSAGYRWDKGYYGGSYLVYVSVFNNEGIEQWSIFRKTYATKESAKRAFKRQVAKIKKGEY